MTDPKLVFPGLLVLFSISGAQAQVTIDVWLHGYYSAKRGNTIVDTQQFKANVQKVTQYCRLNSGVTASNSSATNYGVCFAQAESH